MKGEAEKRVKGEVQRVKNGLPDGWVETTLGEFCPFTYGKNLPKKKRDSS